MVNRANDETSLYLQDSWRIHQQLIIDAGWRMDHDQILGHSNMAPRGGFGWSPPGMEGTRFFGGYARIFDPTPLRLFVRPFDQSSITSYFNNASNLIYGPVYSIYAFGQHVQNPRADIWNLGAEQTLPRQMQAKLQLLRRRSSDGFDYQSSVPVSEQLPAILAGAPNPGPITAIYTLNNDRQDKYRFRRDLHQATPTGQI